MTPDTRKFIADLDAQWREFWNERAGILEYLGLVPRETAEQIAWMETSAAMLKSRVMQIAEKQAHKPHPLTMPKQQPIADRKMLSAGDQS